MCVSKWKDKREVLMVSTKHTHSKVNTTNSRKQVTVKQLAFHDVSQYARIEEFHSLENIGPTASKSVFCDVEYVLN